MSNKRAPNAISLLACAVVLLAGCGSYGEIQDFAAQTDAPGSGGDDGGPAPRPRPNRPDGGLGEIASGSVAPSKPVESPPEEPDPLVFHSLFCGDKVRGDGEQCDSGQPNDFCTAQCRARDALLVPPAAPDPFAPQPDSPLQGVAANQFVSDVVLASLDVEDLPGNGRYFGEGPHPISAGELGFAVTFVDLEEEPTVRVALFRSDGDRLGVYSLGDPSSFVSIAHPVVAALPGGSFAVAWAGFHEEEDDELAILLQRVDLETGPIGTPTVANVTAIGAQHSPDILWDGDELVVAWADDSSADTGPDLRFRTFSSTLSPTSSEQTLTAGAAVEGGVSLAPFAGTWAAVWRSGDVSSGFERVVVSTHEGIFASTEHPAGGTGDRPSLVELDPTHLLVVFTEGTDPDGSDVFNTSRLRYGVIDVEGVATFTSAALPPLREPYASQVDLYQREPIAVRAGDSVYVAWRSESIPTPFHEEVWLKSVRWNKGLETLDLSKPEGALQVSNLNRPGDQRAPKLAPSPVFPSGALIAGWVDYGRNLPGSAGPDIVAELRGFSTDPCFEYEQQATPPFSVGMDVEPDGTAARPYPICTVEQLEYAMATASLQSKNFVLAADLDLSGLEGAFGTSAPFTGTFDGAGHVLANYQNLQPSGDAVGFVEQLWGDGAIDGDGDGELKNLTLLEPVVEGNSYVGAAVGRTLGAASIRNVHVAGGSVSGHDLVGGIAGQVLGKLDECTSSATVSGAGSSPHSAGVITGKVEADSSVERSSATGAISGFASDAGGVAGLNQGTILRASATGQVSATLRAGGLVGTNSGAITDSFARGAVTASDRAGGLIGQNESTATVTGAYAVGDVTATTNGGALVGYQNGRPTYSATFSNSTLQSSLPTVGNLGSAPSGIVAKTDSELKQRSTYLAQGWDFVSVWAIYEGDDYAVHLTDDYDFCGQVPQQDSAPFAVGLGADGSEAKPYPLCTAGQMQYVADTGTIRNKQFRLMGDIDLTTMTGSIGALSFGGVFDGKGHRLTNYTRNVTPAFVGLFFDVSGAVKNLTLEKFQVSTGTSHVGALAGYLRQTGRVENVHVIQGLVRDTAATSQRVGGLIGLSEGTVLDSSFSGIVESIGGGAVGGLVGFSSSVGRVERSRTTGLVQLNGPGEIVGGLVGQTLSMVADSSSSARVRTNKRFAGGLLGSAQDTTVINSSAIADVVSNGWSGGLVGFLIGSTIVNGCSATGHVAGSMHMGGLVGVVDRTARIEHSSSSADVECTQESCGGLLGHLLEGGVVESSSASGTVRGAGKVGGLLGGTPEGANAWVTDCHATGDVFGSAYVGGLVGYARPLVISRSWSSGDVTLESTSSPSAAGGLVGFIHGYLSHHAAISDSFARGNVIVPSGSIGGGFIGTAGDVAISNSYSTGAVTDSGTKGGFIGNLSAPSLFSCSASFWNTTTNSGLNGLGTGTATGFTGRTTAELMQEATYTAQGWDFTTIWKISEGQGYAELQ